MKNIVLRVLVFFIGIPFILALILAFPEPQHLVFNVVVILVSALGALELSFFFEKKAAGYRASVFVVPILGASLPLVTLLHILDVVPLDAIILVLTALTSLILTFQVFRSEEADFSHILSSISANVTLIFYPGLFLAYVVRISTLPQASFLLLIFVCSVFFNDTMAYITGMLFGKKSRRVLSISPNKSLVGFIGGFLMSPVVIVVSGLLIPDLFPGPLWRRLLFGGVLGIVTIIGDLVESAMKRSATVKDSGQVIPGRGGLLDSVDSPLFTAPAFFYLYTWLFM